MSEQERIQELIALKSLGLLEGEDSAKLEASIKSNGSDIEKGLREFDEITDFLLYSTEEIPAPENLKQKLFNRIEFVDKTIEMPKEKVSFLEKLRPLWYGLGPAFAAVALFFYFSNQSLNEEINELNQKVSTFQEQTLEKTQKIASLENELLSKEAMVAKLEQNISKRADLVGYLGNPNVIVIDLGNLKTDINSLGRVMWNKNEDSALFYGINLPQTTQEKIYQLWAIIDSKPKSYGIFSVDEEGNGVVKINYDDSYDSIQQFAVTLEPAGGVPQPTGEMYLAGSSKL